MWKVRTEISHVKFGSQSQAVRKFISHRNSFESHGKCRKTGKISLRLSKRSVSDFAPLSAELIIALGHFVEIFYNE